MTDRCARISCGEPLLLWLDREYCSRTCRSWRWAPLGQRWMARADFTHSTLRRPWKSFGGGGS